MDSVAVARPMCPGGAVTTTFYGYVGNNTCAELVRVERQAFPADTLRIRFIGHQKNGNCIQAPAILRYVDSLSNSPARTVHLVVEQRSGAGNSGVWNATRARSAL